MKIQRNFQRRWWQENKWYLEEERQLMVKHRSTFVQMRSDDDPDRLYKRFRKNTCEPMWEGKLRESTKKFENRLVHFEFPFLSEKPVFTVGNNIDFSKWALAESRVVLTENASVYAEDFKKIRENPFEYRDNLIVAGIFVNESVHHRPQFHEQIESVFEADKVTNLSFSLF